MYTVTTKIPDELHHRLEVIAEQTERKKSYLVRQALEGYLEELEDSLIAMARLASGSRRLSLEELERKLGLDD